MPLEFDFAPENTEQEAAFLTEPGKYHCLVHSIETDPRKQDGGQIANALFRVHACVLDGTTPGQQDKEFNLMFFSPKMTDKDNGEMAKKKVMFFCQAIGCLQSVGDGRMVVKFGPDPGEADYDEGDAGIGCKYAEGRQFVVELEKDREGKYVTMRFCNVWHVDHPACKDVPKCKQSLALIPQHLRKSPKDFEKKGQGGTSHGGAAHSQPKPTKPSSPPATATAAPPVDVSDL